jgi:hypothetical protein
MSLHNLDQADLCGKNWTAFNNKSREGRQFVGRKGIERLKQLGIRDSFPYIADVKDHLIFGLESESAPLYGFNFQNFSG